MSCGFKTGSVSHLRAWNRTKGVCLPYNLLHLIGYNRTKEEEEKPSEAACKENSPIVF